ncbi:MAG: trimethylamine methyltransferase family protein [Spirochaetaceae bacterium]
MRKCIDDAAIQSALMQAFDIVENLGVVFEDENGGDFFDTIVRRGARVEGDKIFIPRHLLEEALETTPKMDYSSPAQKRVIAAGPFGNAPFILDDETGLIRRCVIADAVKLYQVGETSALYESANPGCADPVDNDAPDQFIAQVAMALKYSAKYPAIGLRATGSNAENGDVYTSARRAFRLVREFHDLWDTPVMTQSVCPNPPLAYDRECLNNLHAAIDEQQALSIVPCSLGYMTGPESIMGLVVHDLAMSLAGLAFIQLNAPGHPTSFYSSSTISNIQTMQPNYGSSEAVFIQVVFYELCKTLKLPCAISGSYDDGTSVDYQAGMESALTTILPFSLTEVNEVCCYPGLMAGFSCGSFQKAILDEETINYTNRMLRGVDPALDHRLKEKLAEGREEGSFLYTGSMDTYRRDNYLTSIFNKHGIAQANTEDSVNLTRQVQQVLADRLAAYEMPQHSAAQRKLLQSHLPSACRY